MQEAFLYTGQERWTIPSGLTRVRVDPSVTRIHPRAFEDQEELVEVEFCEGVEIIGWRAFYQCVSLRSITLPSTVAVAGISDRAFSLCKKLEEVKLSEGLLEIGAYAFSECKSLRHILIPNSTREIGSCAFFRAALSSIDLPDSLERIGEVCTFQSTRLQHVRIPSLITRIPGSTFSSDGSHLFSVELPEGLNQINNCAFHNCRTLRNIAIPPNAVIEDHVFNFLDLAELFMLESRIISELKHRFDGLTIHRMMYYQSYHPTDTTLENLNAATNLRSGLCRKLRNKLNPSGNQQDCLGMTPLHILACSAKQKLALYQVIVERYPENLITEDKWGC
ncbi:hypothetical protein ACHAXR_011247 [Thalassiosira sp. AJA248-18]